jgi:RHS repeat-associated protein
MQTSVSERLPVFEASSGKKPPSPRFSRKELDQETGFYYYGARYLNPKTSMWISADPAVGDYIPSAPASDEAKKRNENLPGMGGVFNYVNFHVYHYAGNNPLKYIDPDGRNPVSNYLSYLDTGDGKKIHVQPQILVKLIINKQLAKDINNYHCDIMAWNAALLAGLDPRAQDGSSWDGNKINVPNLYLKYSSGRTNTPAAGTAGYVFSNFDKDGVPHHIEFYDYRDSGDSYFIYNTDGKTDPPNPISADPTSSGTLWGIGVFVALPHLIE